MDDPCIHRLKLGPTYPILLSMAGFVRNPICTSLICAAVLYLQVSNAQFGQEYPDDCDLEAAAACEYDFLQCRLFTGPADDPATMCNCGEV